MFVAGNFRLECLCHENLGINTLHSDLQMYIERVSVSVGLISEVKAHKQTGNVHATFEEYV